MIISNLTSCAAYVKELQKAQAEDPYRKHAWSSYTSRAIADEHCKDKIKEDVSNVVTSMSYSEMIQEPTTRRRIIGLEMDCMHNLG